MTFPSRKKKLLCLEKKNKKKTPIRLQGADEYVHTNIYIKCI